MGPAVPEIELLSRSQQGDRGAFAQIIEKYWDRIYHWLFGLTGNKHLAEDLAQDTFMKAWANLAQFKFEFSFRSWIFSIARHAWIDGRKATRKGAEELRSVDSPAVVNEPLNHLLDREGADLLQAACRRLPEHFREAFMLWSREQMNFLEIGQALGITEATARWRVFKARALLVQNLAGYLDEKVR